MEGHDKSSTKGKDKAASSAGEDKSKAFKGKGKAGKSAPSLPNIWDLSAARKALPPGGTMYEVGDTKTGRLRAYYTDGGNKISAGSSLDGRAWQAVAVDLIKWCWQRHAEANLDIIIPAAYK